MSHTHTHTQSTLIYNTVKGRERDLFTQSHTVEMPSYSEISCVLRGLSIGYRYCFNCGPLGVNLVKTLNLFLNIESLDCVFLDKT